MYGYIIHLICGDEFEDESELAPNDYIRDLCDTRKYKVCRDSKGNEVIVDKGQVQYIEVINNLPIKEIDNEKSI